MKKIKFQEKGQALILIVLGVVVLVGFAALAIDGSMVFSDKRHAQNAADTSAIAAALALAKDPTALYADAGHARSTSNGYDNNQTTNFVDITAADTPPGGCPDKGLDITVKITSIVKTTFARVLGWKQLVNHVSATARACLPGKVQPLYPGSSVWSTKPSGVSCTGANNKSISNSGSGNVTLDGGGLGSSSIDGSCIDLSGNSSTILLDCAKITTAAGSIPPANLGGLQNTTGCNQTVYGVEPAAPPVNQNITCSQNAVTSGNTMSPGNYNGGTFPPAGVTQLNPGTYCVTQGDFKLNGNDTLTGTGVTIVMQKGYVTWDGGATVQLTAPTTPNDSFGNHTQGLLLYLPPYTSSTNSSTVTLSGNGNSTITGTVLAQESECKYAGTGDTMAQKVQFICYTWTATGTSNTTIIYDPSVFYQPANPSTVSLLY